MTMFNFEFGNLGAYHKGKKKKKKCIIITRDVPVEHDCNITVFLLWFQINNQSINQSSTCTSVAERAPARL